MIAPEILRTPEQWCEVTGVEILDPDGWRMDGQHFEEPIGFEEFERRLVYCTIRMPANYYGRHRPD